MTVAVCGSASSLTEGSRLRLTATVPLFMYVMPESKPSNRTLALTSHITMTMTYTVKLEQDSATNHPAIVAHMQVNNYAQTVRTSRADRNDM